MTKRYRNKYRSDTLRLRHWDYGWNAAYFVTIRTANRIRYFGEVANGEMQLSDIGQWAHNCWEEIPMHFPFVVLDAFIVMPDHVPGIIIDKPEEERGSVETHKPARLAIKKISHPSFGGIKWG